MNYLVIVAVAVWLTRNVHLSELHRFNFTEANQNDRIGSASLVDGRKI